MKLSTEDLEEIEHYVAALAAAHCDERVSRREFEREISAMIVFAADDYRYLASRAREMANHYQRIGRES